MKVRLKSLREMLEGVDQNRQIRSWALTNAGQTIECRVCSLAEKHQGEITDLKR